MISFVMMEQRRMQRTRLVFIESQILFKAFKIFAGFALAAKNHVDVHVFILHTPVFFSECFGNKNRGERAAACAYILCVER
jgi:hypothetical protein